MANTYNIELQQGSDFYRSFTVYDVNGGAMNLSGFTIEAQLRKTYNATEYVAFVVGVINSAIGKVSIGLSNTTTATIIDGRYVYDIVLKETATSKRYRIAEGIMTVTPSVSRPIV